MRLGIFIWCSQTVVSGTVLCDLGARGAPETLAHDRFDFRRRVSTHTGLLRQPLDSSSSLIGVQAEEGY